MIKSELVQIVAARNPHLYHRDVENIVNAILDGDEEAAREAMRHHLKSSQARYRALLRAGRDGQS